MSFCLDTKGPKNQDLYVRHLGSRPSWLKSANSLRSDSADFLTPGRPASILRHGGYRKGRLRNDGMNGTECKYSHLFRLYLFLVPQWPFLEEDVPQDEKPVRYVKNSYCLSEASLRILVTYWFFKASGRTGLDFWLLLGNAKVTTILILKVSFDEKTTC